MATEAHGGGTLREYNLLATFADIRAARRAAGALKERGLSDDAYSIEELDERPGVDEARMRDELEGSVVAPGVGPMTGPMTSGAVTGGITGVVLGGIIGLVVGALLFLGSGHSGSVVGIGGTVIICALALGVAGAVVGGFVGPRNRAANEPKPWAPESDEGGSEVVLAIHVDDKEALNASEEVLKEAEPIRLDRLNRAGDVLSTKDLGLAEPPVQPGSGRVVSGGSE